MTPTKKPVPKVLPPMFRVKYDMAWPPIYDNNNNPVVECPDWKIERDMLALIVAKREPKGSLGFAEHFKQMITLLFGREDWKDRYIWTPYAEAMLDASIKHKFLGIAGHASSGKSVFGVIWALGNWLIAPGITKVFITSTSLTDSRQRIWGVVERYWAELVRFFGGEQFLPGELISSRGIIRSNFDGEKSELAGLSLIAGEKSQERDSVTKIGFKAQRVILIGDEMPLLSEGLYNAAKGNLFSNPDFSMIGIGNPDSYFDSFGTFVEPKDGWGSINENMDGWVTKLGYCLKFDGERCPNVLAGREIYPGLLTLEKVQFYKESLGPDSADYWRMVRGFFSPTGKLANIYSPQEFYKYQCDHKVTTWVETPVKIIGMDLAWTHDGDKVVVQIGKVGLARDLLTEKNQKVLELIETIILTDNAKLKDEDRNEQTLKQFIDICKKHGIRPEDTGFDSTGGGVIFGTLIKRDFGTGSLEVNFGGSASDLPVSKNDKRPGKERYTNKVSELWMITKELIRTGQIRGLNPETMKDLVSRTYATVGERVKVEGKKDMKQRTGFSPDIGDAFVILVQVARQRHGLASTERAATKPAPKSQQKTVFNQVYDLDAHSKRPKQTQLPNQEEAFYAASADGGSWGDSY